MLLLLLLLLLGTVRVKCLAQEHSTMSPARARTRTARSGVERTSHEATAPPRTHRHMRVEFVVCFSPGSPVFLHPQKKKNTSKF